MQGNELSPSHCSLGAGWDAACGWWEGGLGQHLTDERLVAVCAGARDTVKFQEGSTPAWAQAGQWSSKGSRMRRHRQRRADIGNPLIPHPSSLIPHPSSLLPPPSSLLPRPSSLIPRPSCLIPRLCYLLIHTSSSSWSVRNQPRRNRYEYRSASASFSL